MKINGDGVVTRRHRPLDAGDLRGVSSDARPSIGRREVYSAVELSPDSIPAPGDDGETPDFASRWYARRRSCTGAPGCRGGRSRVVHDRCSTFEVARRPSRPDGSRCSIAARLAALAARGLGSPRDSPTAGLVVHRVADAAGDRGRRTSARWSVSHRPPRCCRDDLAGARASRAPPDLQRHPRGRIGDRLATWRSCASRGSGRAAGWRAARSLPVRASRSRPHTEPSGPTPYTGRRVPATTDELAAEPIAVRPGLASAAADHPGARCIAGAAMRVRRSRLLLPGIGLHHVQRPDYLADPAAQRRRGLADRRWLPLLRRLAHLAARVAARAAGAGARS